MSLKGKTSRKLANGQKIYEFEKEIDLMGYFEYVLGLYACLSYDVAVFQWITSCHKNRMTTRVITLLREYVTSLTTSVTTI